jgi:hypothetical protein
MKIIILNVSYVKALSFSKTPNPITWSPLLQT